MKICHDRGLPAHYCIEAGKLSDYVIGPTTVLASDENARRMAWILDRYRDTDAATHAAIGIIVQDHFGRDRDEWARQMAVIQGRYPEIVAKAARIWDQSAGKTPAGGAVRPRRQHVLGGVDERRVLDRVGGDRRRRGDGEHHIRVWADARHGQHSGHAGL